MLNQRTDIEILFKNMSYDCIDKTHDSTEVNGDLYKQYARAAYPHNSPDEINNSYKYMKARMGLGHDKSIFNLITDIADKMLIYDGAQIKCRFDELLRWREVSFQMGQDFFTCAYLAKHDIEHGKSTKYFAWSPIIPSDNDRIMNILDKGMAENHFHLAGSTKIFELNWICLMNMIEGRNKNFNEISYALQLKTFDTIIGKYNNETLYQKCQKAALYRLYLFVVLKDNDYIIERTKKFIKRLDYGDMIGMIVPDLQGCINTAKDNYAVELDGAKLDYAYEKGMSPLNDNACRLLAGERRFLYECYLACLNDRFENEEKDIFYKYLILRTDFRNEMIQVNRNVGFANFKDYQDRKTIFIKDKPAYNDELVRLAVNESVAKPRLKSLENRIGPVKTANEYVNYIKYYQDIDKDAQNVSYVISFPKSFDKGFAQGVPRNHSVRKDSMEKAIKLVQMLKGNNRYKNYIKGIDACSSEIACRPEVFGYIFRFLTNFEFTYDIDNDMSKHRGRKLKVTYHAGEDFLDIVDGLRAIDEAILFCNMERGSRIGHGLALGIAPENYYSYKNNVLLLPKQILLDDIVWLICKTDELGCHMDVELRTRLKELFADLFKEIYDKNLPDEFRDVTIYEYFQSWKLRGDNPELYKSLENTEFEKKTKNLKSKLFRKYELNDRIPDTIRQTEKYRWIYFLYHFDKSVREEGDKIYPFKVPRKYAEAVRNVQDGMIKELVNKGIAIETNPSSNYLIGTIEKYDEHPIIRFNSRKLKDGQDKNMSLSVSINTDDQGVFDTSLENEYALMTLALKKAKDQNSNPLYDIENIYEWIDYVREMGIQQTF